MEYRIFIGLFEYKLNRCFKVEFNVSSSAGRLRDRFGARLPLMYKGKSHSMLDLDEAKISLKIYYRGCDILGIIATE